MDLQFLLFVAARTVCCITVCIPGVYHVMRLNSLLCYVDRLLLMYTTYLQVSRWSHIVYSLVAVSGQLALFGEEDMVNYGLLGEYGVDQRT